VAISFFIHFFSMDTSVWQERRPVLSSSGELLLKPHSLPILLHGTSAFHSPSSFVPSKFKLTFFYHMIDHAYLLLLLQ